MTRSLRQGPIRRADVSALTPDQRLVLERGYSLLPRPFVNDDEMERAWRANRKEIRTAWIEVNPGSRPFAEWKFELVPKFGERLTTRYWSLAHEEARADWETYGILHLTTWPPCQELESEFLDRHKLLTARERRTIGPIIPAAQLFERQHPEVARKIFLK